MKARTRYKQLHENGACKKELNEPAYPRLASMNIAIEASNLIGPNRTGVGVYGENLINNIASMDSDNQYYLCYRLSRLKHRRFFFKVEQQNFRTKIFQEPFNQIFMKRLDLYHGLDARVCKEKKVKKLVTIHDLLQYNNLFPATNHPEKKIRRYRKVMASVDRIIADSQYTKADILNNFPIDENQIDVVYLGVDEHFQPKDHETIEGVLKQYHIRRPYLFYVGCLEARKNLGRTMAAFSKIKDQLSTPVQVVLAGASRLGKEEVFSAIEKYGLEDDVNIIGYARWEDLPYLYSGAETFLFPSLYEGFGLPVLEAMACGTPVLTSNVTSLPEVAGDAAIQVDPYDVDAIASALISLLETPSLRDSYIQKGLQRAKEFKWERAARQTLAIYKKVVDGA